MNLGVSGRVALVLGAGGGLGRAIALELAREGAVVAVAGHHAENTSGTVQAIVEAGGRASAFVWDLSDLEAGARVILAITEKLGPIDIFVGNTGGPAPSQAQGIAASDWQAAFCAMVLPLVKLADAVLPAMKERGWGRLLICASSGVIAPIPNLALSNSLRASLVGWSKTLASEVARHGVTVNVIVPGRIATDRIVMLDSAKAAREGVDVETVTAQSLASIPAGRYGEPEEFAKVATFLTSEAASYVTGSIVRVDGGLIGST